MKTFLIAVAVGVFGFTSVQAADVTARRYVKAPVTSIANENWTGCYAGGNAGGGWHRIDQTANSNTAGALFVPPLPFGSSEGAAVVGGVQIGCDIRFAGDWVAGAQGMLDFGNIKSSNASADPRLAAFGEFQQTTTKNIYTATARLGYLLSPQILAYAKGGGAWTSVDTEVFGTIPFFFPSESVQSNRAGWVAGGGFEWMFAPKWSVFVEYNYIDFGQKTLAFIAAPGNIGAPSLMQTNLTQQTALAGVNYRFYGR